MSFIQITDGWYHLLLQQVNLLDESRKRIAKERMSICAKCHVRSRNKCDGRKMAKGPNGKWFNGCGCLINAKILCTTCHCPGDFW